MKLNRECFQGVWSAMSTPLTAGAKVDQDALKKLIEHQLRLGIRGVFIAGTAGEGPFLTDAERLRLAELTVKYAAGRMPVAMQITDNSAERMIENLGRYQDTGIDIAVIAPPFFHCGATQDFLFDLYDAVIAASKLPVGIYNRGKYSSVLVEPATLDRLLDNPRVMLVKDSASAPEFTAVIQAALKRRNGSLYALCGNEFDCVTYLEAGYDGLLLGGGCFNGAYACEIHRLVRAGRHDEAVKLQEHLNEVMYQVFGGRQIACWLAGQKELMVRLGVFNTAKTLLSYRLNAECSAAIDRVIAEEKSWLVR